MKVFAQLRDLFLSKIGEVSSFITLVKLEMRLAKLSIVPLLMNVGLIIMVLMTLWPLMMVLLGCFFMHFFNNFPLVVALVLLLNVGILLLLFYQFMQNIKKMSFEKTRRYLFQTGQYEHDNSTQKSDNGHCEGGKNAL